MKVRERNTESIPRQEPSLPTRVDDVEVLECLLSEPTTDVVDTFAELDGDVLLLGVNGKLGPSLARMVKRASELAGVHRRVIGVSRFTSTQQESSLQAKGIETVRCDLLNDQDMGRLPDVDNVVFLAGRKFGATGQEASTWATNTWLPTIVCRKFQRSRIVALSTGNVYGLSPVARGGSRETDPPLPVGEYAMSCLGRERMFEYFSDTLKIPIALVRLNYACDLRYGVLVDLAQRIWDNQPIDLATSHVNTIWQGDANAMILECFRQVQSPPRIINVTGPELLNVRNVCEQFGAIMNRTPTFVGAEMPSALLSDAKLAFKLFGLPRVTAELLIAWVADWIMCGRPVLGKPTGFESRDGRF